MQTRGSRRQRPSAPPSPEVSPDGLIRGARNQAIARNIYRRRLAAIRAADPSLDLNAAHSRVVSELGFSPPGITVPSVQPRPGTVGPPSGSTTSRRRPPITPRDPTFDPGVRASVPPASLIRRDLGRTRLT